MAVIVVLESGFATIYYWVPMWMLLLCTTSCATICHLVVPPGANRCENAPRPWPQLVPLHFRCQKHTRPHVVQSGKLVQKCKKEKRWNAITMLMLSCWEWTQFFVLKYDPYTKRSIGQFAIFDTELVLLKGISFMMWDFGVPVLYQFFWDEAKKVNAILIIAVPKTKSL